MKKLFVILFSAIVLNTFGQGDKENGLKAITVDAVRGQLEFLASDWTEGREVGTKGEYLAADYIESMFKVYGIQPFGDMETPSFSRRERNASRYVQTGKSYFQTVPLIEYEQGDQQSLSLYTSEGNMEKCIDFGYLTDFNVRTAAVSLSGKAPVVFLGYAYQNSEKGYNDLENMDLKGKIVLVMDGFPGIRDTSSAAYKKFAAKDRFSTFRNERNKLTMLENAGAVAVIQVLAAGAPLSNWAQNQIYPVKGEYYESEKPLKTYYSRNMDLPEDKLNETMPVFTVSKRVANELVTGTGLDFEQFEKTVAQTMQPQSKVLPGKIVSFKSTVKSKIIKARNVIGYIEGTHKDEFIVVGAHYDHLGRWNGWTFNGADDNASGTVGVMTLAKAFMATGKKPQKSIIFAAWTGEEMGLLGSSLFVMQSQKKNMKIVLNLNYDMIARDAESDTLKNKASMNYTKGYPKIEEITRENVSKYKIDLNVSYRPSDATGGGSDHAPFAKAGIPYFYFMAAMHPDYHLPSDELSKINWDKMTNIIRLGFLDTWDFANSNEIYRMDKK